MKIAYLIAAHNNPKLLELLVDELSVGENRCFIHLDAKSSLRYSDIHSKKPFTQIKPQIPVYWGGFSQVESSLLLMKSAVKGKFDRYVLLSGTSFPVVSQKRMKHYFISHAKDEFINCVKMPGFNKSFDRLHVPYFEFELRSANLHHPKELFLLWLNNSVKKLSIKKPNFHDTFSLTPYAGSTWWGLTHSAVKYVLTFCADRPDFVRYFKTTLCADEMFFQTILCNSPFSHRLKPNFTFVDWGENDTPVQIQKKHLHLFHKQQRSVYGDYTPLFARKFDDTNLAIIKELKLT